MPTHTTAKVTHPPVDPAWRLWSKAWTKHVRPISGRTDLTVIVTPGAGQGAPACHTFDDATIEVDATHVPIDPTAVDPKDLSLRPLYATGWGLLVHEAAHSKHTVWPTLIDRDTVEPEVLQAAYLLEEARMEGRHLRRRRKDRQWLHAATTSLILPDVADTDTVFQAANTAALILARADTGILRQTEIADARRAVQKVLGRKLLKKLEVIWRRALRTRDDDHAAMLEWGRRWLRALGRQPHVVLNLPGQPGTIREAVEGIIITILAELAEDACDAHAELDRRQRATERASEQAVRKEAKTAAEQVFSGRPATGRTRPPSAAEQATAGQLTRALRAAAFREPTITKLSSPVPPGRLNLRQAMSADVQRQMGQHPDSQPWTRRTRHANPRPPLHLGIATDVSSSMGAFLGPAAATGWILSHAVTRLPASATASVTFGERVRAVTRPGQMSSEVRTYQAEGATDGFVTAVDALDHVLGLSQVGTGARLLVIISDGHLPFYDRQAGQGRIDRLLRAGCGVLWIGPTFSNPLAGGQTILAADATKVSELITKAALAALHTRT